MKRSPASVKLLLGILILLLALFALGINLFLLARRVADPAAGVVGCGGGDCAEVLASRWAQVLRVPVTALGALVWCGVMVSLTEKFQRFFMPLSGAVAGAAFWFIFVQAVILKKFCPWCMTAHGVGLVVTVLGCIRISRQQGGARTLGKLVFWTYAAFLGIGLAQIYGPQPATHQITDVTSRPVADDTPVQRRGTGPKVVFFDGLKTFDVGALPHLGPANARRVVVEYFDYTCPACRTMSGYLDAMRGKKLDDFCVIVLPVPLERSCNRSMTEADTEHPGSCETARLALAVWRTRPEVYPELHRWLMEVERTVPEVRTRVLELVSTDVLDAALKDPWIHQLIAANVADWVWYSAKQVKSLPKILIGGKRVLHGLPAGGDDFARLMEPELGL